MSSEVITSTLSPLLEHLARRLATADGYDVVKGSVFDNDEYELWTLGLVTFLVLVLGSLAAGAGIGGGGLFVPLYAFVLGVGAKGAVPLSKATILGASIGNMISILFAQHPDPNKTKPLIDYEAAVFMQSGELLGVVFGVLLNLILPEIIIVIFLALLLGFNAYKTLTKGMSKYREETRAMAVKPKQPVVGSVAGDVEAMQYGREVPATDNFEGDSPRLPRGTVSLGKVVDVDVVTTQIELGTKQKVQQSQSAAMAAILVEDAQQFPLWAWGMLAPMTLFTIFYAYAKTEWLTVCSPGPYWAFYFSPVLVLGGFMASAGVLLHKRYLVRVEGGYHFVGDGEENPAYRDIKWDTSTLQKFPFIAVLAGVAAGLLGIGGGMVIGPLFIQLDVQPTVGSSTCAFMILWTALSGVVQYYFAGKLGSGFIIYGTIVGFVSGQMGQRMVDAALRRYGRPSFVIFLLGGIILAATIAMTGTGSYKLIEGLLHGDRLFDLDTSYFQCPN